MEKTKVPIRTNALLMVSIAAALAIFAILVIPDPDTALVIAIVCPVIGASMAVVDRLCSPEPAKREHKEPTDQRYAFVERITDKALDAVSHPSAESDVHKQGSR